MKNKLKKLIIIFIIWWCMPVNLLNVAAEENEEINEEVKFEMDEETDEELKETADTDTTKESSPLYDNDFYIELTKDEASDTEQKKRFTYDEWINYLDNHNHWVNGNVRFLLSENGKNNYTDIKTQLKQYDGGEHTLQGTNTYTLWAENSDNNINTNEIENGTRSFNMGIDTIKPTVSSLVSETKCYEPTKTDTEQYFAEDFVIRGTVSDSGSGIYKIEYTTDYVSGKNNNWTTITTENSEFVITLSDGSYKAIAVRAYDRAGNISEIAKFVNVNGEPVNVIVDKSEPVLDVTALTGTISYNGDNDNWTNKDVTYNIASQNKGCPYAGLYQYSYAYQKIGDAINDGYMTEASQNWTTVTFDEISTHSLDINEDKNGYYYFYAISRSGVTMKQPVRKRILIQHNMAQVQPMIVNEANTAMCKNGWYNKASGVPEICFEYPDYDIGDISGEYDAPITVHYTLTVQNENGDVIYVIDDTAENNAVIGVLDSNNIIVNDEGRKEFTLTKESLDRHTINFGYDKNTNTADDGIYTLKYWVTDRAGNISEKRVQEYMIDCHEPTDIAVTVDGISMKLDSNEKIVYERFYNNTVHGSADANYGISGKGEIKVLKAKKTDDWKKRNDDFDDGESFDISANKRCFLYIRAEDKAGNMTEGWTRGIIVDNMFPNEVSKRELIIEPEGANKHGFFNHDVKVKVNIKDSPEDDNCAALMTVKSFVGKRAEDISEEKELFSFTKEMPTDDELNAALCFENIQIINAVENESNEAYIKITATDRANNSKTSIQPLKIDVTKPQIEISFDNQNVINGRFYNKARTADIHIHELNFDETSVDIDITRDSQPMDIPISNWTHEGSEHYASIIFSQDGDYTMSMKCTDLADNVSDIVYAESFTIDCTAPDVNITLEQRDNRQKDALLNDGYYNSQICAVITVNEHNFDEKDFLINVEPLMVKGVWSHNDDTHVIRLLFDEDNAYKINCSYTDMAGNQALGDNLFKEFVIDTASPVISIYGVDDGSSNSGNINPVISVLDANINADESVISVKTGKGKIVKNNMEVVKIEDGNNIGYKYILTDMNEKEDNIYYLTVSSCDMAGNKSTLSYRFSLNRNGSNYDLTDVMNVMKKQYNTYSNLKDIEIVEMNVDEVEEFDVYISRNGELGYKAKYDREVEGSDSTGYTYIYKIKRENFLKEGNYRLSFYSKDRAGNEVNNTTDIEGNDITFIVDNTVPRIIIDGVETGMVYDVKEQNVSVIVTDNFKLSEAELTLINKQNEILQSWNYMDNYNEGEVMYITIPQNKDELSLIYRIKDAAGNEMQTFMGEKTALSGFLVTTDKIVQFINRPAKMILGNPLVIVIMVMAFISVIILIMNRNKIVSKFK